MMCLAIAGPGNYDVRVHIGYIMMRTAIAGSGNCDVRVHIGYIMMDTAIAGPGNCDLLTEITMLQLLLVRLYLGKSQGVIQQYLYYIMIPVLGHLKGEDVVDPLLWVALVVVLAGDGLVT